jgi:septum formation protein
LEAVNDDIFFCVGAYQIEALGSHLFTQIAGDHSTVLGLPVLPLLSALRREKLILE